MRFDPNALLALGIGTHFHYSASIPVANQAEVQVVPDDPSNSIYIYAIGFRSVNPGANSVEVRSSAHGPGYAIPVTQEWLRDFLIPAFGHNPATLIITNGQTTALEYHLYYVVFSIKEAACLPEWILRG